MDFLNPVDNRTNNLVNLTIAQVIRLLFYHIFRLVVMNRILEHSISGNFRLS
jgi:hypothetical protein